jgi:hypothetical protein
MKLATMQPKRLLIGFLFAFSTLFLSACAIRPVQSAFDMNNVVTHEMEFEDFEEVEVSDAFAVQIRQGDSYQVTIEVDDISDQYLRVTQHGDTLEIGLRPRFGIFFWHPNPVLRAEITMPAIEAITARDASTVEVNGFSSDQETRFEVADASSLEGEIDTGDTRLIAADASEIDLEGNRRDVEIEASDASEITLRGAGQNVDISASDSSEVNLAEFTVEDASVEVRDASNVTLDARGTLDVEASDASKVVYYGNPIMGDISTSDGSSIEARR